MRPLRLSHQQEGLSPTRHCRQVPYLLRPGLCARTAGRMGCDSICFLRRCHKLQAAATVPRTTRTPRERAAMRGAEGAVVARISYSAHVSPRLRGHEPNGQVRSGQVRSGQVR